MASDSAGQLFEPKLDVLPDAQRAVWTDLIQLPKEFVLYGGTAIAVQLGHRQSVDFDFFAVGSFDPVKLYSELALLEGSTVLQQAANTLTCRIERDGPVIVSFFGVPSLRRVAAPQVARDNRLPVLAPLDDPAGSGPGDS